MINQSVRTRVSIYIQKYTCTYVFTACLDGEHMFKEISDDVHLVKRYDSKSFSKYGALVKGSWLYRYWICLIMYVTDKINEFSEQHRKIMKALFNEKQILMVSLFLVYAHVTGWLNVYCIFM